MKRKRRSQKTQQVDKRQKLDDQPSTRPTLALLRLYYPQVVSLRDFLAAELPKHRRRELLRYGRRQSGPLSESATAIVHLLDHTFVGCPESNKARNVSYDVDLSLFTSNLSASSLSTSLTQGTPKQTDIVDFVLWLLFKNCMGANRPSNLLCHGHQRGPMSNAGGEAMAGLHGLYSVTRNAHVEALRQSPWSHLPSLLKRHSERIMSKLLIECGTFVQLQSSGNLVQISGQPLSDMKPLRPAQLGEEAATHMVKEQPGARAGPSRPSTDIRFVRHRMLYSRPLINASGKVTFGLGSSHVLERNRNNSDEGQTVIVAKYLFPRQFGLHNAFASDIDQKDTVQTFKDYTIRDEEIARHDYNERLKKVPEKALIPKRLRGQTLDLVSRLRKRHARCSYHALLQHHCPNRREVNGAQSSPMLLASTPAEVSAFCRAAVTKVFPPDFWGAGDTRTQNIRRTMRSIDRFVRLRRYETMSMHETMEGVAIRNVSWLSVGNDDKQKMCLTDFEKRKELMAELLYYLVDSFLIPLIRGSFHVTESSTHRNQVLYFRHDVWKELSDPALEELKANMLQQCSHAEVKSLLARRALGVSRVRLLPKNNGMRPIINLRRRVKVLQGGRFVLGKSINSLLTPAFTVLNCEKAANPDMLGSALFSVDAIFPRLQQYQQTLEAQGQWGKPLYFAKCDVQAAFDTIPQKRLMQVVQSVMHSEHYQMTRYSRASLLGRHEAGKPGYGAKAFWKFLSKATAGKDGFNITDEAQADNAEGKTRAVYVDGVVQRSETRRNVLNILGEHVGTNLLKLGPKYYRQKQGIPQGSIVSSLLCSYIYAELEREVLSFLNDGQTVLLRLIDDFLVVSTSKDTASEFMRTMHRGAPEFGVLVKHEKSLANFDIEIDGRAIARVPDVADFPYCGHAIDTQTLDMKQDRERRRQTNLADSVTVEYSKLPGQSFYRKMLNAAKLNMRAMLLSTTFNSLRTVLSNVYHSFWEVAQKSYYSIRSMSPTTHPSNALLIRTVDDVVKLVTALMRHRRTSSKDILLYACAVNDAQARWLGCKAFLVVYKTRQTKYRALVAWLETQLQMSSVRAHEDVLKPIVEEATGSC